MKIKMFIDKKFHSEFLKNVLTLFSGASLAQLIPILVSPILSRMYSPEQFGIVGVIMSVVGVFSIVATFQYEAAIMLPKKDEDAFNLLTLAIGITLFISLFAYATTSLFHVQISNLLKVPSFSSWVFIIPFFVLLTGLFNSLNIWTSRQRQYKRLAFRQIAQTTVSSVAKLILGWLKYLNSGLIWGTIAGQLTSTGVLAIMTLKDNKKLFRTVSFKRIKENAIIYKDFPKYTMWQGFFDLINASGVIFILSSFYGVAVVGLYGFAITMLQKPTSMIGQAVSQVFYQNAARKVANNESIYKDTIRLIKNLGLVGGIIFFPVLLFGPQLFSFVFGAEWSNAGLIAQIVTPWFFLRFIASPLSTLAMIKQKQKAYLFISTGMNLLMPSIFIIVGTLGLAYKYAFFISSLTMVIYLLFTIKWVINFTKDKPCLT